MHAMLSRLALLLLIGATSAGAQTVVHNDEHLARDRPEAWALNYFVASTFMTGFGDAPALRPMQWAMAVEAGQVPRLSEAQQRVGFNGVKQEDLNRSPVFGRLRLSLGLPAGWVAELGYTPPLTINRTQPRDLVAVAIGRRVLQREHFSLALRVFGQHGRALGDITCPQALAGITDIERNPYGCRAASRDQVTLDYYGAELAPAWSEGPWQAFAGIGAVRTELAVQVDALTFDVRDRSRLVSRGVLPFATVGAGRELTAQWRLGFELLYVPLSVRRTLNASRENDPLTSARLELRYRFD
jgi:hypothetical protein